MKDSLTGYIPTKAELKFSAAAFGSLLLVTGCSAETPKVLPAQEVATMTPTATATATATNAQPTPEATKTPTKEATVTPLLNAVLVMDGDCKKTRLLAIGARYINNPDVVNSDRLAGPSDIAVGESPKFGEIVVIRKDNPNDPASKEYVIARAPMVPNDEPRSESSEALVTLNAMSNIPGKNGRALAIQYYFDNDKREVDPETQILRQPRYKTTVSCGATKPVMGGRLANPDEVMKALKNIDYRFKSLGVIMEEAMKRATKNSAGFPNPDNYDSNRKATAKYLDGLNLPKK